MSPSIKKHKTKLHKIKTVDKPKYKMSNLTPSDSRPSSHRPKNKLHQFELFDAVNLFFLTLFGIIMLLPIMHVVSKGFSAERYVLAGDILFWPLGFQLDTIRYVLQTPEFSQSFLVSVVTTLVGTFAAQAITLCAAFPLSKPHFRGRKFFLYLFVFTMLFNAGMVPNYMLYRSLGLLNTLGALILPGMFSAFNLFMIKNYFESLPDEIEEAARIDGAGNFTIFYALTIPMSLPVIATTMLYYAVGYWSSYFSGVMYITDPKLKPLQQYMLDLITQATNMQDASGSFKDLDQAMNVCGENIRSATIVVSTIPILLVYPYLQRYFVKGITIGSVKG